MIMSIPFIALPALLAFMASTYAAPSGPRSGGASKQSLTCINQRSAQDVISALHLTPNDEKGYYVQTFEDPYKLTSIDNRSISTAIYYLLEGVSRDSVWHRVDATEVWHYYAGAPLMLSLSNDDGIPLERHTLGPDIFGGQSPQIVVPRGTWQSARSFGAWTLVGTTGKNVKLSS